MSNSTNNLDFVWKILEKNDIFDNRKMRSEINNFLKAAKSKQIHNLSDLLNKFGHFTHKEKSIGIWLFGRLKYRKAVPLLLTLLEDEKNNAWEICTSLGCLGGKEAIQGLKKRLETEKNQDIREAIVHSFSFFGFDKGIAEKFICLAENRQESPKIRAQAAEGLGCILQGCTTKSLLYKKGYECVFKLRKNRNAEIRFNAYFALSSLKRKEKDWM
jgi:HEAT repeat protein